MISSVENFVVNKWGDLDIFLAYDEAQVEIRVAAEMSEDAPLIKVIRSGADIHQAVGHDLTGLPPETFAKGRERVMIKARHFSIVYGKIPENCYAELVAQGIDTTLEEVQEFYDNYFEKYKGVKDLIEESHAFAEKHHYVKTMFGFTREITKEKEGGHGASWMNQAINTRIQGTAHQMILVALAQLKRKQKTYAILRRLLMEIHDALYWKIKLKDLREAYKLGKYLLEDEIYIGVKERFGIDLKVPLKAESKVGFRLGTMMEGYEGGSLAEFVDKWLAYNKEVEKKVAKSLESMK